MWAGGGRDTSQWASTPFPECPLLCHPGSSSITKEDKFSMKIFNATINYLIHCHVLFQDPVVKQSLSCLRHSVDINGLPNTYTTALMAYVFTLARDMETRTRLLNHLRMDAVQKGESFSLSTSVELKLHAVHLLLCCRRLPLLGPDISRNLSLSVCGDQLLCASGHAQCFSYQWRPGLRSPHRQVAHNAAELLWRILLHTGEDTKQCQQLLMRTSWWISYIILCVATMIEQQKKK